ncbi:hypothetical protein EG327_000224 [Venturia inaequalis]|uniref:Uncharacterized protein n=1 Tax=Venturia inaequalis TaxID=5025 RepID=A0A8H3VQZ2_VENIN|nr:hypothetical protein EG327_000224 [Venturia inaequalis]
MLSSTRFARASLRSLRSTNRQHPILLSPILRHTLTTRLFSNSVRWNQGLEPNNSKTTNDAESSSRQFTEEEWQKYWADKSFFGKLLVTYSSRDRRYSPKQVLMLDILTQINLLDLEFRNVGVLEHEKENEKCYSFLEATTASLRSIGGIQFEKFGPADDNDSAIPSNTTMTDSATRHTIKKPKYSAEATLQAKSDPKEKKNLQDACPRDTSNPWNQDWKAAPSEASQTYSYKEKIIREKTIAAIQKEEELRDAYMRSRGLGDWKDHLKGVHKNGKFSVSFRRRYRELCRADSKGEDNKYLELLAARKKIREGLKFEMQSLGVDATQVESILKGYDILAEIVKMEEWRRSLSRYPTKAEREKMISLVTSLESLLAEDDIPAHRDRYLHIYTEQRRQKLKEMAEAPLQKIDIEALSVAQLEDREIVVDDLQAFCIWSEYSELLREFPNQGQEWDNLLRYNVRKIDQALKCLAEFYRIALWLKEMDRITDPDTEKKAKADKFLDEWANHFDERPAPGERLLPISQRLNIVMNRAMEQIKRDIKIVLLTPPPKAPEKKSNWKKQGRTADMVLRDMLGAFKPSPERAKAKKANEDYQAQLEAQEAKIAAAKWKKENGSKPLPSDSKPKLLPGTAGIAANAAAKRGQTLRRVNSPSGVDTSRGPNGPKPERKTFVSPNRKGGKFGKFGKGRKVG